MIRAECTCAEQVKLLSRTLDEVLGDLPEGLDRGVAALALGEAARAYSAAAICLTTEANRLRAGLAPRSADEMARSISPVVAGGCPTRRAL